MSDAEVKVEEKRVKYANDEVNIRPANKSDMVDIYNMIKELAEYEKMPEGPKITSEDLIRDGFETIPPRFRCLVAEVQKPDIGTDPLIGYALYFPTYSTWEGRSMMMEDLYVKRSQRGKGVGARLFQAVVKEAHASKCKRLDFHVLQWNDARLFYETKGAINLTEEEDWCYYRLSGNALEDLANDDPSTLLEKTKEKLKDIKAQSSV